MAVVKIDEINANILRKLISNARTSFTEMSKENNITVVAVRSRYENLKQTGLIKGAIMQVNPYVLGYNCNGYLRFKISQEKIQETIEFLNKKPYILSTWQRKQEFNLGSFFGTPNLEYFDKIKDQLKSYPHIEDIQHFIFVGFLVNDHPEKLIIKTDIDVEQQNDLESPNQNNKNLDFLNFCDKPFVETSELLKLPELDRKIAKMLSEDARVSFRHIAKKLQVSTNHVIKIYKKLRKNNLLLRATITLDLRKLGYKAMAMVYFNIKPGTDFSELHKKLINIPNLIVLIKTIGETDLLAITPISTFKELFKIKASFLTTKGIEAIQFDITPPHQQWPNNYFAQVL